MKKIILYLIVVSIISACKKDPKICANYTDLKDTKHLVDISPLKAAPELIDTLNKHPNLQVFQIYSDQYITSMKCNIFFKGMKILNYTYGIYKTTNSIFSPDVLNESGPLTFVDSIKIASFNPAIDYLTAINIAKKNMNYGTTCISYRLGIYCTSIDSLPSPKSYKLAWAVQGENGYPYVYLDANNGQVYDEFDGVEE
ncbi:MAG: hypothetical protein ABI388_12285 [Bacteroidia bacterium]